ncbi:MAG TPA: zinc ribbon domain-containing protein [Terriglobales bacterium]|nr:zinc ribbon domain-containing protein [Terriglobales bacterium]
MFARASEGLSHIRGILVSFVALLLGAACLFFGVYFMGIASGILGRLVLLLCWLLYFLIAGTGVSATGIMLLDRARATPARPTSDAIVLGLICFLKCCVIGMAVGVVALLVGLVAALIFFICKIPGVGPLLLFFVHPVLVVIAGLLAFLASVFGALVAPSLWGGDTITQAVAKAFVILKERAVVAVLYLLVMGVVTALILGIMGAVILPGYFSMTGLAAGVIGTRLAGGIGMLTNLPFALMYLSSGESGHMLAVLLSTAVLALLCIATALQVQLMGLNLVYLGISEGVDTVGAERLLKQQFDQAKTQADEAKQRALEAAERAKQAALQRRTAASPLSVGTRCPSCNDPTGADDAFCENCGHKLR